MWVIFMKYLHKNFHLNTRSPFENFVDWRQCAAVMLREAVTVMASSGGGNVVVA
jgi:hypothetical protein